jgi:hypothetical protein
MNSVFDWMPSVLGKMVYGDRKEGLQIHTEFLLSQSVYEVTLVRKLWNYFRCVLGLSEWKSTLMWSKCVNWARVPAGEERTNKHGMEQGKQTFEDALESEVLAAFGCLCVYVQCPGGGCPRGCMDQHCEYDKATVSLSGGSYFYFCNFSTF